MSISKAEKAYIQTGLLSSPPRRQDGRPLLDFRSISLETGVAPLANGSARLLLGDGTEVLAATKLQVDDDPSVTCTVTCSPTAYPHLSPPPLKTPKRTSPRSSTARSRSTAPRTSPSSPARKRGPSTSTCSSSPTPEPLRRALHGCPRRTLRYEGT